MPRTEKTCSVEGCDNQGKLSRGLCAKHYAAALRAANPEYRARQRENARTWRAANLEKARASDRERRNSLESREQRREYLRAWREANAEYIREFNWTPKRRESNRESNRATQHRRRAVKLRTQFEQFLDTEIFERDGWRCHICKRLVRKGAASRHPLSPSLDHIVPLSKGGTHTRDNVACAHLKCNLHKQASLGQGVQPLLVG